MKPSEPDWPAYLNWIAHADATLTFPQTVVLRYTFQEQGRADAAAASDEPEGTRKGQHGGWLPRVAQTVAAVFKKDHSYTWKLADRWYYQYPMLKERVDEKMSPHSGWERDD